MKLYRNTDYPKLKYKFLGSENIKQNYSQTCQDMFVLTMLNGKKNGTFLEIGANDPIELNNTYLLETEFGWKGISIEIEKEFLPLHKKHRNNTFILNNALDINYTEILSEYPKQIDYLQVDIDGPSFQCLSKLPLDIYRFSTITFEHDSYQGSNREYIRKLSREMLKEYNYTLVAGNISNQTYKDIYEDWWIDSSVINSDILEIFGRNENICVPGDEFLLSN